MWSSLTDDVSDLTYHNLSDKYMQNFRSWHFRSWHFGKLISWELTFSGADILGVDISGSWYCGSWHFKSWHSGSWHFGSWHLGRTLSGDSDTVQELNCMYAHLLHCVLPSWHCKFAPISVHIPTHPAWSKWDKSILIFHSSCECKYAVGHVNASLVPSWIWPTGKSVC